jgi:hypothetical protein
MTATGDRDRVELQGAEPPQDLEHRVRPSLERPSRRDQLAGDEEPASGLGCDLH